MPLTTLVCAILIFLHLKNQRMADGDGIEMNEPFSQAATGKGRSGHTDSNSFLHDDDTSSGGYVPPGQEAPQRMSASEQYAASSSSGYETHTQTGGGDFGGGGSAGGGWCGKELV